MIWGFGAKREDPYRVDEYKDGNAFAKEWQYEFADMLGVDEDEGYDEALTYWKRNHTD